MSAHRIILLLICTVVGCELGPLGSQQGYMPEQPIPYSHALHAGLYEMDCQYCHTGAERSRHAGVPPASVCMNCHAQIKTDSAAIQTLAAHVKDDKPLPWVKVHRLPDFAYFNHSSHVGAGLRCQGCHGAVEQMVRVEQKESMSMGWCLSCHRTMAAQKLDAPPPLATLATDRWDDPETIVKRKLTPPTDCSACHR